MVVSPPIRSTDRWETELYTDTPEGYELGGLGDA